MSEKRFTVRRDEKGAILIPNSILKDGEIIDEKEVVDLLNEQQELIEEKSNVIILMGAFIKSKGFSVDDFNEWISKDWHNVGDDL